VCSYPDRAGWAGAPKPFRNCQRDWKTPVSCVKQARLPRAPNGSIPSRCDYFACGQASDVANLQKHNARQNTFSCPKHLVSNILCPSQSAYSVAELSMWQEGGVTPPIRRVSKWHHVRLQDVCQYGQSLELAEDFQVFRPGLLEPLRSEDASP